MKCSECEKELKETDLVCPKCGKATGYDLNKIPEPINSHEKKHDYDPNCALCRAERIEQNKVLEIEDDVLAKYDDGRLLKNYNAVKKLIANFERQKEKHLLSLKVIDEDRQIDIDKIKEIDIMIEALKNAI